MSNYEIAHASRLFPDFIDKLSNWYIRRSRKRFWKSENDNDKNDAYQTLYEVLAKLSQTAAPLMPFIAEEVFQNINAGENNLSVHLLNFPEPNAMLIDEELNIAMQRVRHIVTLGLSCRAKKGIKVRQPLKVLYVEDREKIGEEFWELVREELNVKEIKTKEGLKEMIEKNKLTRGLVGIADKDEAVALDCRISRDLHLEGEMRELTRQVQEGRKKAGFNIEDRIILGYVGREEIFNRFGFIISREVLAEKIYNKRLLDKEYSFEVKLGREKIFITMRRVRKKG